MRRQLAEAIAGRCPTWSCPRSSEVVAEFREYERASTTVLNAYLAPEVSRYLQSLRDRAARSGHRSGDCGDAQQRRPGGPGGRRPSPRRHPAVRSGRWGGGGHRARDGRSGASTSSPSTWAAPPPTCAESITDGPRWPTNGRSTAFPAGCLRWPSTRWAPEAAASGGPTRVVRSGWGPAAPEHSRPGLLRAGRHRTGRHRRQPRSRPDLGRGPTRRVGRPRCDCGRASPLAGLGRELGMTPDRVALGMVEVVEAHMHRAIRKVSVEEGADPRRAALVAFGGAGGLHATALARRLEMDGVIVPPFAGVFSAVGLLLAPPRADAARTVLLGDETGLPEAAAAVEERGPGCARRPRARRRWWPTCATGASRTRPRFPTGRASRGRRWPPVSTPPIGSATGSTALAIRSRW